MKKANSIFLMFVFVSVYMCSFVIYGENRRFEEIEGNDGTIIIKDNGNPYYNTGGKILFWTPKYLSGKNWYDARTICENLSYSGYTDWRLPTKDELGSLYNFRKTPEDNFPQMPNEKFWSSTSHEKYFDTALIVDFENGDHYYVLKKLFLSVRCVFAEDPKIDL